MRKHLCTSFLLTACALVACQDTGRIKRSDEADLVGNRVAGAAAYNLVVEDGVRQLLESHAAEHGASGGQTLAVMGVENRGADELGDWGAQLYDLISTEVHQSGSYRTVSRRLIDRALSASNLRQDDLFLLEGRRRFLETLELEQNPVQLLLFPSISTGSTSAGRTSQRDTILKLELVDVTTGWDKQFTSKVRKEYTKALL